MGRGNDVAGNRGTEQTADGSGGPARRPLTVLAFAVLAVAAVEFFGLGLLRPLTNQFDDLLLRANAATRSPDPDIVLVDIDERSLERMAPRVGRYPWPRSVHAELIEGIAAQDPEAIVFDILFSDPDHAQPAGDTYLVETARKHANTFFPLLRLDPAGDPEGVPLGRAGQALGFRRTPDAAADARAALLLPLPGIAATGRIGTINFREDPDGVGRRYPLYLEVDGWRIPSLPAKVARALDYPVPERKDLRLNWTGPALSYERIPYADLYRDLSRREPRRPADELTGKVVVVGATASGLHDLRTTPVASLFPAVEMVATALDNLKNGDGLRRAPAAAEWVLTLLLVAGLYLAVRRGHGPLRIGAGLLAALPLLAGGAFAALQARYLVPVLGPALFGGFFYAGAAGRAFLEERRAREHSVRTFSRFLDPRVVKQLLASGESVASLRGESREVTVLFSDIRGFTSLSERSDPERLVTLLNDYFSRQVRVIFGRGGTVDKFIGDAIMAFWGAPVADRDQAVHAVAAALKMAETVDAFRREVPEAGEGFDIGIGVHTGEAVVGFIGAENRLEYTAIGDTVNLASRIEGQTKGVARVLVSEVTRAQCGEAFDFIDRGKYKVKGREQEVRLFEPRRKPA